MRNFLKCYSNSTISPLRKDLLYVFLSTSILYLLFLGSYPLLQPDEIRYAEVSREMLLGKDFVTPKLLGAIFFDKPILFYWLQSFSFKVFGISAWSARLVSAVAGVLGCLSMYMASFYLYNRQTAIIATAILASTPLYFFAAHYANLDILVAIWISMALFSFMLAVFSEMLTHQKYYYAFYVFMALAVLTKGLIGLVLPGAIIGLWILCFRQWHVIKQMRLFTGILLFLLVVTPWFVMVQIKNPNFAFYFFYLQHFKRFTADFFNNLRPWYFYLICLFVGMLPWSLLLARFAIKFQKNDLKKRYDKKTVFLVIWACVILLFFSIPKSKLIGYILPAIPSLVLLLAMYCHQLYQQYEKQNLKTYFTVLTSLLIVIYLTVLLAAGFIGLPNAKSSSHLLQSFTQKGFKVISYYANPQEFVFYSQQPITIVNNWNKYTIENSDRWYTIIGYARETNPELKKQFIVYKEFWKLWNSQQPILVIVKKHTYKNFLQKAKVAYIVLEQDKYLFVTNQSNAAHITRLDKI